MSSWKLQEATGLLTNRRQSSSPWQQPPSLLMYTEGLLHSRVCVKGSNCSTSCRGARTLLARGETETGFGKEPKHRWNRQACVPEKQGAPERKVGLLLHPMCPLPLTAHAGHTPTALCSQANDPRNSTEAATVQGTGGRARRSPAAPASPPGTSWRFISTLDSGLFGARVRLWVPHPGLTSAKHSACKRHLVQL